MPIKIFFSWQDDTDRDLNRHFIFACLQKAAQKLRPVYEVGKDFFIVDKDTTKAAGWPGIADIVQERISEADIYVADLSFTDINEKKNEGRINSNVIFEAGLALASVGPSRIVTVMNTAFNNGAELPFNFRHRRWPIDYNLSADTIDVKEVEKDLIDNLKNAIQTIIDDKGERDRNYYHPFENWDNWQKFLGTILPFETNSAIENVFTIIRGKIGQDQIIFRVCGLSCIGKTRTLFECFRRNNSTSLPLNTYVLYADRNVFPKEDLVKGIISILKREEKRILIIDNCSKAEHAEFSQYIRGEGSRLSLITITPDPTERLPDTDGEQATNLLYLRNDDESKNIVRNILTKNNFSLSTEEIEALVDFSDGLPYVAVLMANNKDRRPRAPGLLHQQPIVERLLGSLYTDKRKHAAVMASSLFSEFGYTGIAAYQATAIAMSADLCPFDMNGVATEDEEYNRERWFRETCDEMTEKGLLSEVGRMRSFRLMPLAMTIALEWWERCTPSKFNRIIEVLAKAQLVDKFCEQFQYLPYSKHATSLVGTLCEGVFSSAEVLNTSAGSRLFRSFVNVNRPACISALEKAFATMPVEQLKALREGRRNLVWALEKLCFYKDTFERAIEILALFAVAENENIGNNATGQFFQLFHIQLPGTMADLSARWNAIDFCLQQSADFQQLAIGALSSALTVGPTHRMSIPEEPADRIAARDYRPKTSEEIDDYRRNCINTLYLLSEKSPFSEQCRKILLDKFYGLCVDRAGSAIIPTISQLYKKQLLSKEDIRSRVQLSLESNRIFDKETLEALNALLTELEPKGFIEQFRAWVKSPTRSEYRMSRNDEPAGKILEERIKGLAQEFLEGQQELNRYYEEMLSNHLSEGYRFGKYMGEFAVRWDGNIASIIHGMLSAIKRIPPAKQNFAIISGILTGFDSPSMDIRIFNDMLAENDLVPLAFFLARERPLNYEEILKLVAKVESKDLPINAFSVFYYAYGLRHLNPHEIETILERLRKVNNEGKVIAFNILEGWTRGDEVLLNTYTALLYEMVLHDSEVILESMQSSMDLFEWGEACVFLLQQTKDRALAEMLINLIVIQSNDILYYANKEPAFRTIMAVIAKNHFDLFWEKLNGLIIDPGDTAMSLWNLKGILGTRNDSFGTSAGLLFDTGEENFAKILLWAEKQEPDKLYWLANLVPVFNGHPEIADDWHPYARALIDHFGNSKVILSGIAATLGTFGWTGTIVPYLLSERRLFEKLLNHPIQNVRDWAQAHLTNLNGRIQQEKDRDKDGFMGDWLVSGSAP